MNFLTTVTGSYPRKEIQKDTLRKSISLQPNNPMANLNLAQILLKLEMFEFHFKKYSKRN